MCSPGRRALPGVEPVSVALHIGSQLTDFAPYEKAFGRVAELVSSLRASGIAIRHLDLGGGIGVPYHGGPAPDVAAYAEIVRRTVGDLSIALCCSSPDAYLVAECRRAHRHGDRRQAGCHPSLRRRRFSP